jgi:competence protein ComEC
MSKGPTGLPHCVQKAIQPEVRYFIPESSGNAGFPCDTIRAMRLLAGLLFALGLAPLLPAAKTLDIYFIDVEGGQATLIVTPSKQSLLVDAGWAGFHKRDATRIKEAAKAAGIKHIDYLAMTHYHADHAGGIAPIAAMMPVSNFIDHGPNRETGKGAKEISEIYDETVKGGNHLVMKPGEKIPLKGLDVTVVAADGVGITTTLPGAGAANEFCNGAPQFPEDPTENARSLGFVLTFEKFRFIDLGDLTSAKELKLVCPANLLGRVDVYLTTHHGGDTSNAKAIVHALHPRVAVMNNGAKKGGAAAGWQIVRSSPGLEDLWQLHSAIAGGKDNNVPDALIANIEDADEGKWLKVSAMPDGSFTVTNSRNKYTKTYAAK